MGIARWLVLAVCLIGCKGNAKSKQTAVARDAAAVKSSAAADAAARPDELAEPPVAALGRTDPEEAKRITSTYNSIRGLFSLGPDDERAPTAAERRALAEIGARDIDDVAAEAGWGEAAAQAWFTRLTAESRDELESVVRFQLSLCVGYGSATPSSFVAGGCFTPAVFFVKPAGDTELPDRCEACYQKPDGEIDACREKSCSLVVEGYFTGEVHSSREIAALGEDGPVAHVFHVQKTRVDSGQTRPTLRLPGGHGPADGPAISSGPKWGVTYANAFATDPGASARARAQAETLRAKGFEAEVMDSRRIPGLWCCSQAVLIGRFDGREAAKKRAAEVTAAGLPPALVREIY